MLRTLALLPLLVVPLVAFQPVIRTPQVAIRAFGIFEPNLVAKSAQVAFLREAELKHGRLAMLATLIIPTLEHFTDGLGIDQFQQLPDAVQVALVSMMMIGEFSSIFRGYADPTVRPFTLKDTYQPGDAGFGLWGAAMTSNRRETESQMDHEINHGRVAMLAALGMIAQELATHQQLLL